MIPRRPDGRRPAGAPGHDGGPRVTYIGSKKHLQDKIESAIIRRIYSSRLDGYTLETAEEIMKIVDGHKYE
jgi:hypothetical protein